MIRAPAFFAAVPYCRKDVPTALDLRKYADIEDRVKRVRDLCGGFPDVVLEIAGIPQPFIDALRIVGIGGRAIEIGNMPGLTATIAPSMVTFKSIELTGVVMYPPHYLRKSLDFLSTHMERYQYREMLYQGPEAPDFGQMRVFHATN